MAKVKQYKHRLTIRLSDEGIDGLQKQAAIMGLTPTVAGRAIIEHSVKDQPIKQGGKDVPKKKS